jgi:alcohol dehydrogenase
MGVYEMKAVVFHDNGDIRFESVPEPVMMRPADALVRVTTSSICSTDIHIKHHGNEMQVKPGTILGHEFVGVIEEIGKAYSPFSRGDRVAVSCTYSCGECYYCKKQFASQCPTGACFGAMGDGSNHGAHAEFIRVPYASRIMHKIPDELSDEDVLFVGDILSTGLFGVELGNVKKGDTVIVCGAGPVGICVMLIAQLYGASKVIALEKSKYRADIILAKGLADHVIHPLEEKPSRIIKDLTHDRGADVVIDASGDPRSFGSLFNYVRPAGSIALIGVYNDSVNFPIYKHWWKNLTIRMGLVETNKMGQLMEWIRQGRINTRFLITRTLPFNEIMKGYDMMDSGSEETLKVAIKAKMVSENSAH